MKKILSFFLVLLMLLPCTIACQNADDTLDETTAAESTDPDATEDPFDDRLPDDLDYSDMDHSFMFAAPQSADATWGKPWYNIEEDSGDTVDSAIFNRNRLIEDRFGIIIESMTLGWTHSQATEFATYAVAVEEVIDVICVGYYQSGKPLIVQDYVLPWNDVDYLDLDRDWWNKSITKTLSVCGNYYYLSGDVNWFTMPETSVCYFNKVVAGEQSALVGNLYQTVLDGKWTFDTCYNIAKEISNDSNGDGKWDDNDTYGAIQNDICGVTGFLYATGYETVFSTNDGPLMNYNTAKMSEIINWTVEFCSRNHVSYREHFDYTYESKGIPIFFDDRALFYFDILMHASTFRDKESDFGILPYPKFDEAQKDYISYANQWGLVSALPSTAKDADRTAAILHAMGALSRKLIVPAYYEKTLMGKIKRDDESEEMLNIIFQNVLYDFGLAYSTEIAWPPVNYMVSNNTTGLSSWWRAQKDPIETNFWELYEHVYEKKYGEKPVRPKS